MEEKMLHGNTGWAASTHVTVVISVQISAEVRVKVKYEINHMKLTASGSERVQLRRVNYCIRRVSNTPARH